jgi:hypothetical protein
MSAIPGFPTPFTVAERAAHALLLERPETEQYGN